ncbi:ArnT family glycosyltransferase [Mucilaginibacter calamicampi]|uniref:ArnT family glycosyltransferase n=1 Tax=Mucilaginibacter calamicampi TaxID=1302352 RepID=A0ABW2Z1G9_9SPHI
MNLKQSIKNWSPGVLQIIVLLTLLQLFITLLTNGFALSADEAMWHYIGRNWFRHGLVPYSGGVDNKSPLFFAVFGLSDLFFGVNYWFPRVLGTLCQSAGIYYIYKIAYHIAGKQAAMLAISFYGLSVLWHCADGKYVSYTETYEVLFIIIAFYIFLTRQNNAGAFLSGFPAAVGLGFRLSAIFGIITLFIASLHRDKKYTVVFCAGVLAGLGLLAILFVIAGINLGEVFTYALTDNFGTGSTTDHSLLWRLEQLCGMFFYSEMVLFYPLLLAYWFIKRKLDWLLLWLLLEFIGLNIVGNYARIQLKDLLPAFSLISAFAVTHIIKTYNISAARAFLIVWVCFFPKLLEPLVNLKKLFVKDNTKTENISSQPDESRSKQLGLWIKANTTRNQKVFVAGFGAQVQVYSERLSPTIYFNVTQTALAKKRFFADMETNQPDVVLVPRFPEYVKYVSTDLRKYVDSLVARSYHLEGNLNGYNIYRIKSK